MHNDPKSPGFTPQRQPIILPVGCDRMLWVVPDPPLFAPGFLRIPPNFGREAMEPVCALNPLFTCEERKPQGPGP